jgi:hypothetical protein
MGENAEEVQAHLRRRLSEKFPDGDWGTERKVGGTPVDVAGSVGPDDGGVLVELEWRRADPADNTAKILRQASETLDGNVRVFQIFTLYYELSDGGVSSKRKSAEFVVETAAETVSEFEYFGLTLDVLPPKRGGKLPAGWEEKTDEAAEKIAEKLRQ